MKCLTLQIDRVYMSSPVSPGMMLYVKDHNPGEATDGITIHSSSRVIRLDEKMLVHISNDLVFHGMLNGDVVLDGENMRILRASYRLSSDGFFELIPERADDKDDAIVYFDIGNAGYARTEYVTSRLSHIASGVSGYTPFLCAETVMLATLRTGGDVFVNRYSLAWFFFGEEILREQLIYTFDGTTVKLARHMHF